MTTAKLTCQQSELHACLSLVGRAVSARASNYPILANVRLQTHAASGRATLTAFDLSLGIQCQFVAQCSGDGALTLPARLLGDIVARLPAGELTLEWTLEDDRVAATLVSASGRFELRGTPADQFPELPDVEAQQAISLSARALQEGLGATLFAASADESKQVLTGVHLRHAGGSLEFAATDGHRLALLQASDTDSELAEDFALTIPARALRELEKMLGAQPAEVPVTLRFDDVQVIFELDRMRLSARRVEGSYPAYQQLIPPSFKHQATLERLRLLSSLELMSVLADRQNNVVKFDFDGQRQRVSLSVDAQDVGAGTESLAAEFSGEDLEVAFNAKYLVDGLKALKSANIHVQLNSNSQPAIFSPVGDRQMTYLVMPIQLRN